MPTQELFTKLVSLYKSDNKVSASFSYNTMIYDNADGSISVNDDVYMNNGSFAGNYKLLGTTTNGVVFEGTVYNYLLTNSNYSHGQPVS